MPKSPQTPEDLEAHLQEHLYFLESSADAFDRGYAAEAKRLAVSMRVLFHNTRSSHSLLEQLDRLNACFLSTALPPNSANIGTHGGLILTASSAMGSTYFAPLDESIFNRWLPFGDWWNETVFVDDRREELTRRSLMLAVANQDGGAHVDPKLSETYARLSRHNSLGWVQGPGHNPIPNAERAAIRQIAHEVLKTMDPAYERKPKKQEDGIIWGGAMIEKGHKPSPLPRAEKIGRNDPCPCGSGKKYKRCHGAG